MPQTKTSRQFPLSTAGTNKMPGSSRWTKTGSATVRIPALSAGSGPGTGITERIRCFLPEKHSCHSYPESQSPPVSVHLFQPASFRLPNRSARRFSYLFFLFFSVSRFINPVAQLYNQLQRLQRRISVILLLTVRQLIVWHKLRRRFLFQILYRPVNPAF